MSRAPLIRRLLTGVLLVGALATVAQSALLTISAGGGDFLQFYFAGKLAASGELARLYDRAAYDDMLTDLVRQDPRIDGSLPPYFNRPAFAAFLYAPLALFDFKRALMLWTAVNLSLLCFFAWSVPRWFVPKETLSFPIGICLLVFLPFQNAIVNGHDTVLITLLLAVAIWRLRAGSEYFAGAILALGLMKPHLIWALPLALCLERKWKALIAFAVAGALLGGLSVLLVGSAGIDQWWDLLRASSTDYLPSTMPNLRGLYLSHGLAPTLLTGLAALGAAAYLAWKGDWRERYATALLAGPLFSVHSYAYDYSVAAVAACLVAACSPAVRNVILIPWLYLFSSATGTPLILSATVVLVLLAGARWRQQDSLVGLPQPAGAERSPA